MPATENAPTFEQPREPNIPALPKRLSLLWGGVSSLCGWLVKTTVGFCLGLAGLILGFCFLAGASKKLDDWKAVEKTIQESKLTGNVPLSDRAREIAERILAEKAARKQLAEDYSAIIRHVAEPLTPRYQDCLLVDSYSEECARYLTTFQALEAAKSQDSQLEGLRRKLLSHLTSAGLHLKTIGEINREKPPGWELFEGLLKASSESATDADKQDLLVTGLKRAAAETRIANEQASYRNARTLVHQHARDLYEIAKKTSGETMVEEPMLQVEFDEAWQTQLYNWLTLKNVSGRELKRCTVYVHETDAQGRASAHIHYVDSWPADQTCYAANTTAGEYLPAIRTLAHIQHLQIIVWDAQGRQQLDYDYSLERWHADLARYCESLKFSIKQAPRSSSGAGVTFNFSGMPSLPPADVIVTFVRGDRREGVRWPNRNLKPALIFDWEFRSKLWEIVPERIELALEFKDSGFVYQAGSIAVR